MPTTPSDTEVRTVLTPAMRTLAVRRLAGGFLTLTGVVLVGMIGWFGTGWRLPIGLGVLLGALASAASLLVVGQRAVRRAFGLAPTGLWRLSALARAVPGTWALWVLVVPGVLEGRSALAREAWFALAVSGVIGLLALRVLLAAHRVGELETLADTMVVPTGEEGATDGE
ncbi:hypothetical protein [Gaopeijia maritima]|uniref:Uncharacterized protein n=1 Tax=Gaopeijia maritima TaxID=3119007 RepID=A0ABU9E6V1_9BACT